jgi:uncharacterized protein YjbI with pentapeptide repeats
VKDVYRSVQSSPGKILAELIGKIRSINELTQTSFGKLFQPPVTQSTIARWENGEQMPDKIHFPKIAYFIDFTNEDFQKLLENSFIDISSLDIRKKILSPNNKHLRILKRGVAAWNKWREKNPDIIPELAGLRLSRYDLEDINEINFNKADLREASFSNLSSRNSSFKNANLQGANFNQVYFYNSNFNSANFSKSSLEFVYFNEAQLIQTNFYKAELSIVEFYSANLSQANLDKTHIIKADLREANCNRASFKNAYLFNSYVYGASFWDSNLNGVTLEEVYISPDGKEGLPIKDLNLAQVTFLHRYNPSITKKFIYNCQLEEEAIELASLIVNKYGDYSHTYGFHEFCNIYENYQYISPYEIPHYEIRKDRDCFFIKSIPDYTDTKLVLSGKAKQKIILRIEGGVTESNITSNEIEDLRKIAQLEAKIQRERVDIIVPIAIQILDSNNSDNFIDQRYNLERINGEIILKTNSEADIELMRVYLHKEIWNIINSSLSNTNIKYFKKLQNKL